MTKSIIAIAAFCALVGAAHGEEKSIIQKLKDKYADPEPNNPCPEGWPTIITPNEFLPTQKYCVLSPETARKLQQLLDKEK